MTIDVIASLSKANPVAHTPPVESIERLRRLIEQEPACEPRQAPVRGHPRRATTRALIGALASAATIAVGLVLADASSGPGVNVLADAYAATSGGSGVIAAVFSQRSFGRGRPASALRRLEWIDASTERRRDRLIAGSHQPQAPHRYDSPQAADAGHRSLAPLDARQPPTKWTAACETRSCSRRLSACRRSAGGAAARRSRHHRGSTADQRRSPSADRNR
jgi:hypothetical protein